MSESKGFWSYVHADDAAEGERISQLARDIVDQMEMFTGEHITLFLDRDAIEWGQQWRDRIDEGLSAVAFFIPVLTPRYFQSSECRRELNFFARSASSLGVKELVLPILYVDLPSLRGDNQGDELIELIKSFQWEDWRELRFSGRNSEDYRRGVARLARRLVEANRKADESAVAATAPCEESGHGEEEPGLMDRLAAFEEALPRLTKTTSNIADDIRIIGEEANKATADIERTGGQGQAFVARAIVVRRFAARLRPISDRIWIRANEFTAEIHTVDDGMHAIIDLAPSTIAADPRGSEVVCEFFDTIRTLNESAATGLGSLQGLIDSSRPLEPLSRDLRPPLRRLREGLTLLLEARDVTAEWVTMIDQTGIDCTLTGTESLPVAVT